MTVMPSISLTAAGSGRRYALHRLGVPLVLLFFWLDSAGQAPQVNRDIRKQYPRSEQVVVANIADLRGVPGLLHGFADRELRKAYKQASTLLSPEHAPEDYVVILPDWKGQTLRALGIRNVEKAPAVAVLDQEASLVGVYQGQELAPAALELLARVAS